MKRENKLFAAFLILMLLVVQGCATAEKRLAVDDFRKIDSLKVVRHKSPQLLKETIGSKTIAITGIMFGAIGGGIGGGLSYAKEANDGKDLMQRFNLPDFGEIVMQKFADNVSKEIPGWPAMTIEGVPVEGDVIDNQHNLIVLGVNLIKVADGPGLSTVTTIHMKDSNNNMLWQKRFSYKSKDFSRCTRLDELEADNGKLLHEELNFAADKTIAEFVNHLGLKETLSSQNVVSQ
jgi:hypothetical protein